MARNNIVYGKIVRVIDRGEDSFCFAEPDDGSEDIVCYYNKCRDIHDRTPDQSHPQFSETRDLQMPKIGDRVAMLKYPDAKPRALLWGYVSEFITV